MQAQASQSTGSRTPCRKPETRSPDGRTSPAAQPVWGSNRNVGRPRQLRNACEHGVDPHRAAVRPHRTADRAAPPLATRAMPARFLDVSDVRPVPDNQEVRSARMADVQGTCAARLGPAPPAPALPLVMYPPASAASRSGRTPRRISRWWLRYWCAPARGPRAPAWGPRAPAWPGGKRVSAPSSSCAAPGAAGRSKRALWRQSLGALCFCAPQPAAPPCSQCAAPHPVPPRPAPGAQPARPGRRGGRLFLPGPRRRKRRRLGAARGLHHAGWAAVAAFTP